MNKLTAKGIKALCSEHKASGTKGTYPDGGGLYLSITKKGLGSYHYRFQLNTRECRQGLGKLDIGLAEARERRNASAAMVARGINPIDNERRLVAKADAASELPSNNFHRVALDYIKNKRAGWKIKPGTKPNKETGEIISKSEQCWLNSLRHVEPVLGHRHPANITPELVAKALRPIWNTNPVLAGKTRQRIEKVLEAARAKGLIDANRRNAAIKENNLEFLLPDQNHQVTNQPALPYKRVPDFWLALDRHQKDTGAATQIDTSAQALRLAILTGGRSAEIRFAKWAEFNFSECIWWLPPDRMKAGKEHIVPLSKQAMAILAELFKARNPAYGDWLFPITTGRKNREPAPMSENGMLNKVKVLHENKAKNDPFSQGWVDIRNQKITVHGFRSTFSDWVGDETMHGSEVAEMALAHQVKGVAGKYRRGRALEKRALLMQEWADYCTSLVS